MAIPHNNYTFTGPISTGVSTITIDKEPPEPEQLRLYAVEEAEDKALDDAQNKILGSEPSESVLRRNETILYNSTFTLNGYVFAENQNECEFLDKSYKGAEGGTEYQMSDITLRKHYGVIKDPKEGTMIFDGNDNSLKFFNGVSWQTLADGPQKGLF